MSIAIPLAIYAASKLGSTALDWKANNDANNKAAAIIEQMQGFQKSSNKKRLNAIGKHADRFNPGDRRARFDADRTAKADDFDNFVSENRGDLNIPQPEGKISQAFLTKKAAAAADNADRASKVARQFARVNTPLVSFKDNRAMNDNRINLDHMDLQNKRRMNDYQMDLSQVRPSSWMTIGSGLLDGVGDGALMYAASKGGKK